MAYRYHISIALLFSFLSGICFAGRRDNLGIIQIYGPGAETLLLTRTVAKGLRVVSISEFYADSEYVDLKRPGEDECCPLCDYVFSDDGSYSYTYMYSYNHSDSGLPVTSYWINMTSQTWKDESWTTQPIWWHYVVIHVPDEITYPEYGFLYVSGRSNDDSPPSYDTDHVNKTAYHAAANGIVSAVVFMIPNQPIIYTNDPRQKPRWEDDSIAYTWVEFMEQAANGTCDDPGMDSCYNTSCADPEVVLRMPMCKGVVKAMDTMDLFVRDGLGLEAGVNKFMLAGESKRGWTTWMTGPIDDRVVAMAPVVLSNLNMVPCFHHYYMSFGGWPLYFWDYWNSNIMGQIDEPHALELFSIVDPYSYRQWMDFPKLVISSASDEFFLLDDTHYWWDDLPGEMYFWLLENSGHSIGRSPVNEEYWTMLQTYYLSIITDYQRPTITWERQAPEEREGVGSITLFSEVEPIRISAFSALSVDPERRDWRKSVRCDVSDICGEKDTNITWAENTQISDNGDGSYSVEYNVPQESDGFLAFYMRMEYEGPEGRTLVFSTEANIIPSYFPYDDCSGRNCTGILK